MTAWDTAMPSLTRIELICGHGYTHDGPPRVQERRTDPDQELLVHCELCQQLRLITNVTVRLW